MSTDLLPIEKAAQRDIKSVQPYLHLFPKPDMKEKVANKDGNVMDTVRLMRDVVFKYLGDTKLLAPTLKGKTLEETCRNVWDFWYWHVQYKLDNGEELRRPARTIYEQLGDCDCFSIAVCSTLLNLHIDCNFSVAKYLDENGVKGNWQHVYVTVRKPGGGYYTLDCVAHGFNKEQPYADKFDFHMSTLNGIPITVLSGFGEAAEDELFKILNGATFEETGDLLGLGDVSNELDAIYKHLVSTRDYIQKNPQSVLSTGGAAAHLQMLNYAINKWNTPERAKALDLLEQEEERWNEHNGVNGLGNAHDDDEIDGLGAPKSKKKFWSKVKEGVKDAEKGVKNAGKKMVQYNPLSIAVRGGFLLAMKINLLKMGSHLYPAYLTEEEAKAKGIDGEKWNRAKRALDKVEKMFVKELKGKGDKLKSAIVTGRAKKHFSGFGSLGEPATITAVVASAAPIIAAAKSINGEGATGTDGKLPEDKGALVGKIKEWWKKAFGKEDATAPETVSDEDKEPNDEEKEKEEKQDGDDDSSNDDKSSDERKKATNEQDGAWVKLKNFVQDNPAVVGIGIAAVGTIITLAVVHSKHKKPKPEENKPVLSGAKKKRKRKALPPALANHAPVLL